MKQYLRFKHTIALHMEESRLSDEKVAAAVGLAVGTFKRKKIHPEQFRYPEVIALAKVLKLTDQEIVSVIK